MSFTVLGTPTFGVGGAGASGLAAEIRNDGYFAWQSGTTIGANSLDTFLSRGGAAATLQLGAANALAPVNQILQAQGSRAGTDSNVAGANLNIQPGTGTGNSVGAQLLLRTPAAGGSGNAAQTMTTRLTFNDGFAQMAASRFECAKGADVAAANDLTLGLDGNVFVITGNTQINAITTANWQAGSEIILIFSGTPTVKNNTAGGAGTAKIFLALSADLVAAANTILKLVYDGTQWQEVSRKVA